MSDKQSETVYKDVTVFRSNDQLSLCVNRNKEVHREQIYLYQPPTHTLIKFQQVTLSDSTLNLTFSFTSLWLSILYLQITNTWTHAVYNSDVLKHFNVTLLSGEVSFKFYIQNISVYENDATQHSICTDKTCICTVK